MCFDFNAVQPIDCYEKSSEPSSGASSPQILRRSPGIMETSPSQSNKFDYRAY